MGECFNVEVRDTCLICGSSIENIRSRTYCSELCRNKRNYLVVKAKLGPYEMNRRQREYLYDRQMKNSKPKIQCLICNKWYRQVGSHVVQVHKITAREYREAFGFDVKRGQLPDDLRKHKGQQVFDNGTVRNLKAGQKFWFKNNQPGVGIYKRSEQTMERLKNLHKLNRNHD